MEDSDKSENVVHLNTYMVWRCGKFHRFCVDLLFWHHMSISHHQYSRHIAFSIFVSQTKIAQLPIIVLDHFSVLLRKCVQTAGSKTCSVARACACTHRLSPFDILIDVKNTWQSSHHLRKFVKQSERDIVVWNLKIVRLWMGREKTYCHRSIDGDTASGEMKWFKRQVKRKNSTEKRVP